YFDSEKGIDISSFCKDSEKQAKQKIFNTTVIDSMESFINKLDLSVKYIDLFRNDSDHIFGREFYVYTTFSESQADVNPVSEDGFKMIIEDLFYLLSSGSLSMMRMDAIKYLWKKIGCKNFDMDEGNRLIRVIRLLMTLTTPSTIPLDEINSPDPIVYKMGKDGGFSYLFGQVNAVPAAFNEGTLEPLIRFNKTLKEHCPANLVRFVMLSTHDGRSVQGLGVQREDGHVTVEQFYNLKDTVESRGGKPKYRSVAKGEIAGDTFRKVFKEAKLEGSMEKLEVLFDKKTIKSHDIYRLKDQSMNEADLVEEISSITEVSGDLLKSSPAIDYFLQWIIYGKTAYELCCTSRSVFSLTDTVGNDLAPEEESDRLVQAQLFVLTQGQDVPAIYLNDLLGLENDFRQYEITGKPRDLIRHKNYLPEMVDLIENDPFTQSYSSKLNKILELRGSDKAFYPGSPNFEFIPLSDTVFLNHPYHDNKHSLIIGNIVNRKAVIKLKTSDLTDFNLESVTNALNGEKHSIKEGILTLEIEPFGMLWLS
ncbi:MAG: hypothetical protein GY760_22070, partial [Deltaproteobacteria bacterium]|nr:hypothetical protein [Deltaproteobacteria bacterium]